MKKTVVMLAVLFLLAFIVKDPGITKKERKYSIDYLDETLNKIKKITRGMSEKQLNFKTAPERWSIRDNIEHLINVEGVVQDIIEKTLKKNPEPGEKSTISDEGINEKLAIRTETSQRFKAPERLQPSGRYNTFKETFDAWGLARQKTIDYVKTTKDDLRNHFSQNPVLGNLDCYQWTLFISAHTARHIFNHKQLDMACGIIWGLLSGF